MACAQCPVQLLARTDRQTCADCPIRFDVGSEWNRADGVSAIVLGTDGQGRVPRAAIAADAAAMLNLMNRRRRT